jgi:hypothetical protein
MCELHKNKPHHGPETLPNMAGLRSHLLGLLLSNSVVAVVQNSRRTETVIQAQSRRSVSRCVRHLVDVTLIHTTVIQAQSRRSVSRCVRHLVDVMLIHTTESSHSIYVIVQINTGCPRFI